MLEQQIEIFTRSLTHMAVEYTDPSVILQHIPVLKNNLMFQQNPEYVLYGLGGIVVALIMLRVMKKRMKKREKNIAMVMPQPYIGEADHAHTDETAPASFDKDSFGDEDGENFAELSTIASPPSPEVAATRTPAQQLEDVSAIKFSAQAALTPDEARARVMVQAALNDFGAGYMIMARTALSAILSPSLDAVGIERAHAKRAIDDKFLDFGVFDRTGRCLVAIDMTTSEPAIGTKAVEKSIVRAAITQAGVAMATLSTTDKPRDIYAKLATYLKATAHCAASRPASQQMKRPPRPGRPVRPTRPNVIAAE